MVISLRIGVIKFKSGGRGLPGKLNAGSRELLGLRRGFEIVR